MLDELKAGNLTRSRYTVGFIDFAKQTTASAPKIDYLDSPLFLKTEKTAIEEGEGEGLKIEKAVREFEIRNIFQLSQSRI